MGPPARAPDLEAETRNNSRFQRDPYTCKTTNPEVPERAQPFALRAVTSPPLCRPP